MSKEDSSINQTIKAENSSTANNNIQARDINAPIIEGGVHHHYYISSPQQPTSSSSPKESPESNPNTTDICDSDIRGSLKITSTLYINRFDELRNMDIESTCYDNISKQSGLVVIKGSNATGKTSLITRIRGHFTSQGYKHVDINASILPLENLKKMLFSMCADIKRGLCWSKNLQESWNDCIDAPFNCTFYIEDILNNIKEDRIILAIDGIDKIFDNPDAVAFLTMLRSWHEKSRQGGVWENLNIVIAYSTECYLKIDPNLSPFANVGLQIQLPYFSEKEVQTLADIHKVTISSEQITVLTRFLSGHPYLIQHFLYYLSKNKHFDNLISKSYDERIYGDFLKKLLEKVEKETELSEGLKKVLNSNHNGLKRSVIAKLEGLGVVKRTETGITISSELYNRYFKEELQ